MPDESIELSDELEHVLSRAEPEERVVLAMRYLHGWGYSRIASALAVSEGAARVRVHRALHNVRSRVGGSRPGDERSVMAGIAALPLLAPEAGRLEGVIQGALRQARVELAAAPTVSGASAPASSRVAALAIRLAVVLGLVGAGAAGLPLAEDAFQPTNRGRDPQTVAALVADLALGRAGAAAPATSSDPSGSPRPGDWDCGALGRLARGERELDGLGPDAPPAPRGPEAAEPEPIGTEPSDPEPPSDPQLSERALPTVREACAARCDPVSFVDERLGLSGSSGGSVGGPVASSPPGADASADPVDLLPGIAEPGMAQLLRNRASTRIDDLPPEQRAVLAEAAALVEDLVAQELSATDGVAARATKDIVQRAKRKANRRYRRVRRKLSSLPGAADDESAFKASTVSRVLALLVDLVLKQDQDFGRLRWPDGVDVQVALDEVVAVLSEPGEGTEDPYGGDLRLPDELTDEGEGR